MPPPTQTQDRLARAQQPFSSSSSSRSGLAKGKMPNIPTTSTTAAATSTSASTSGFGAQKKAEEEEELESNEMWETRQNRNHAAAVLGSWEMLAWYGISGRESLPQTRLALQKNMLGISSPASDVEWRDDYYGEHPTEQRDGSAAASSAKEGRGDGRTGGGGSGRGGGGSSIGGRGRGSSRRR